MRSCRQWIGLGCSELVHVAHFWTLLLLLSTSLGAHADSSLVYDPFEVPQGAYSAKHIRDTEHTSIIEFVGNYNKQLPSGEHNAAARAVVAREFYRTHADDYDFLVIFSDFEFDTGDALAFYNPVRNDVQGIGLHQFDLSSIYGSQGRLQGYIDMAAFSRYQLDPMHPDYEKGLITLAHEVLHRWGVHVRFRDREGKASDALIGHQDAHWSFLVHTDASVEYGHKWKDLGNGNFSALAAKRFYSPVDLYLMGFYEPEEVPPFFYIDSDERSKTELPQPGITISGTANTVTIDDIIAVEGPRIPSAQNAQKEFKFAFIYLTTPSKVVNEQYLVALRQFRDAFTTRFAILTGGRALAHVYPQAKPTLTSGESEIVVGGPERDSASSVPEALVWMRNKQATQGYFEDKLQTRVRDTAIALETLSQYDASWGANEARLWLSKQGSLDNDSLARRLLVGAPAEARADYQELLKRQNQDGGWGVKAGYASDPLDTALVLRAIASMASAQQLAGPTNYLLNQQRSDGGWSAVEKSAGEITVTALAIEALVKAGVSGEPITRAAAYLKSRQNADGGFGSNGSTVHDTAHVINALLRAGELEQIDTAQAVHFISNRQSLVGDWDGSVYTTALAVSAIQSANFANLSVDAVSAYPESVRDGERVRLTARVSNDGRQTTPASLMRVFRGESASTGVLVSDDIPVPAIPSRSSVTVDFYWDSLDQAGSHQFVMVVDPDNEIVERSELDNSRTVTVNVAPAPEGVDLEQNDGALSLSPAQPYLLPTSLSLSANIRNAGRTDATAVPVRVYRLDDGAQEEMLVDETSVQVPGRQSSVVNFVVDLEKPGSTTFRVVVDPDNILSEENETNNQAQKVIVPLETVDLAVDETSVSMAPLQAFVGEDAVFTVVLRNQGTLPAAPNTVRYTIRSDGTEQVLRTNNIVLGAGESVVHTLTWRVGSTGPKALIVELDPEGVVSEINESNNRYEFVFNAQVLEGTNVGVSHADLVVSPAPLLEGYGATVRAEVKNNGTIPVNGLEVSFYSGSPLNGGALIGTTVLGTIAPGERQPVSVVWNQVPDASEKVIYVQLDPANKIAEFDETDNLAFETFQTTALPDLALAEGSIVIQPAFPKHGEQARIEVLVSNLGAQPAEGVELELYKGDPAMGGVLIGHRTLSKIESYGNGTAAFDYTFVADESAVVLVARVNPDGKILEKSTSNNIAQRQFAVQSSDFYVSERYISPDGNGVKDSTVFSFRFDQKSNVQVLIKDERGLVIQRFAGEALNNTREGSIEWDGRNDFGAIVNDGRYTMEVVSDSGATLGSAVVEVDTNRSSLLKALGTPYERKTDLTKILGGWRNGISTEFFYSPDDEFVFFAVDVKSGGDEEPIKFEENGIYRATAYGSHVTPLVVFSNYPELGNTWVEKIFVSPKSDYIVFSARNKSLWIASVDGRSVKQLISEDQMRAEYDGVIYDADIKNIAFAHDGRWIYVVRGLDYRSVDIIRVSVDGQMNPEPLTFLEDYSVYSWVEVLPSPSSDHLFIAITDSLDWGGRHEFRRLDVSSKAESIVHQFRSYHGGKMWEWSPDGTKFVIGDHSTGSILVYDRDGELIRTWLVPDNVNTGRFGSVLWNANSLELAYSYVSVPEVVPTFIPEDEPDQTYPFYHPMEGIYVINTVTGEHERKVGLKYVSLDGSDIQNPYTVDSEGILWIDFPINLEDFYFSNRGTLPRFAWSPGERRLLVLPYAEYFDNYWLELAYRNGPEEKGVGVASTSLTLDLLREFSQLVAIDIDNAGDFQEISTSDEDAITRISVSSSGRRMWLNDVAYESLLNLSLDVRALRSKASGGVQISGTASDLNLDHYVLDYALHTAPDNWKSVAPRSVIPVVDKQITTWVPPAPGSYYVRMTGYDRAGNVRQKVARASWGEQASITDLYREPDYISPNGDGIQDVVALKFKVLEPVNLALEIYNSDDQLIRTISRSFDLIGSDQSIVWDGRDTTGAPVQDGEYRLKLGKFEYWVTVDATAPSIWLHPVERLLSYYECLPGIECVRKVKLNFDAKFDYGDANYYRHRIEVADEQGGWITLKEGDLSSSERSGVFTLKAADLDSLDRQYRLVVEDLAGNVAVRLFDLSPKKDQVVVTTVTDHLVQSPSAINFRVNPEFGLPIPYTNYDEIPRKPSPMSFSLSRLAVVESVQKNIESVSILYAEPNSSDWREVLISDFVRRVCVPSTCAPNQNAYEPSSLNDNEFEFLVDFSTLLGSGTYRLILKLVDSDGEVYLSNPWLLSESSSYGLSDLQFEKSEYYVLAGVENVPVNTGIQLEIQSPVDPRYVRAVRTNVATVVSQSQTFRFPFEDLLPCTDYNLSLISIDLDEEEHRVIRKTSKFGCTQILYKISPVPAEQCNGDSLNQLDVSTRIALPKDDLGKTKNFEILMWEIVNAGTSARSVLHTVNDPDVGLNYGFKFDTSDYPEGTYELVITAITDDDERFEEHVSVPVDHTRPEAQILFPEAEGRLCATAFEGIIKKDGSSFELRGTEVNGSIFDERGNALTYELTHTIFGKTVSGSILELEPYQSALNNLIITNEKVGNPEKEIQYLRKGSSEILRAAAAKQTPTGSLKVAGRLGLAAPVNSTGDMTLELRVQDWGGYLQCTNQTFHIDASIDQLSVTVAEKWISPNGDGVLDTATISVGVEEDVVIDVSIHDAVWSDAKKGYVPADEPKGFVYSRHSLFGGTSDLEWDGTVNGSLVPDGQYFIVITVTDACGNEDKFQHLVNVDVTPPTLAIDYPKDGDPITVNLEVVGTAFDANLVEYTLGYSPGGDSTQLPISRGTKSINNHVLGQWNTFGLEEQGVLHLIGKDRAGNTSVLEVAFSIPERTFLIASVDLETPYISPNGDGRLDNARVRFDVLEPLSMNVYLVDRAGVRIGTVATNLDVAKGDYLFAWNGRIDNDRLVGDGDYQLQFEAVSRNNSNIKQVEQVSIIVDVTAPTLVVNGIVDGFLLKNRSVSADIADANFESYTYFESEESTSANWIEILQGTDAGQSILLRSVQPGEIEEGKGALRLFAQDKAGNQIEVILDYIVDLTPPLVRIDTPTANLVAGAAGGELQVAGEVSDDNLKGYRVWFQAGESDAPTMLAEVTTSQTVNAIAAVDLSQLPEGKGNLYVEAEDRAGQVTKSTVALVVDNTPPQVELRTPVEGGYVVAPSRIQGSVSDVNFLEYQIDYAPGLNPRDTAWVQLLVSGKEESEALGFWDPLPEDGVYTLRLSAVDQAGNRAEARASITVDTVPPPVPVLTELKAEKGQGIQLQWNPVDADDLAGYLVLRAGSELQSAPVTDVSLLDGITSEGTFSYQVVAVDVAGNRSEPSAAKTIRVDWTPPQVALTAPSQDELVSGLIDVRGTAHSEDDFAEYRLSVGQGEDPTSWQVIARSTLALIGSELGQWDTLSLPEGHIYTLKLEAEDLNGNQAEVRRSVRVDNTAPAAPTGLVAVVDGTDIKLTWDSNTEPDLAGYYLFVNGQLVNATDAVIGDMAPYKIIAEAFDDLNKGDGRYEYLVYAVDHAGNISDSSEPAVATIETRPPHVFFVAPGHQDPFENVLAVVAESEDIDIASATLEIAPSGTNEWSVIATSTGSGPSFSWAWDTTSLSYEAYDLRIRSVDTHGNVDPEPEVITVYKVDLTRPAPVRDLMAQVNGGDVSLTWTPNEEADLAGYLIFRMSEFDYDYEQVNDLPISESSYTDTGLADSSYRYQVIAVDLAGNYAEPSQVAWARVFSPTVRPPYSPTQSPFMDLEGSTPVSGEIDISIENVLGTQTHPRVSATADEVFEVLNVALQPGTNTLRLTVVDAQGNRSKAVAYEVIRADAPIAPVGLQLTAQDYSVQLTWNPNPESDIIGYRAFYEDGSSVLGTQKIAIQSAEGASSSSSYSASRAIDGSLSTYFVPSYDNEGQRKITLTLARPAWISGITLNSLESTTGDSYLPSNYKVEVWTGSYWLPVLRVETWSKALSLRTPYFTDKVRLVFDLSWYSIRIYELTVHEQMLTASTSLEIDNQKDGIRSYTVTAVNRFGIESAPSAPSSIPVGDVIPPEIVTLSGVVNEDFHPVLSWTESPSADVAEYRLYRDGQLIKTTRGLTYTDTVLNGLYIYTVRVMDELGNISEPSNPVSLDVARPLPPAPAQLTVTAPSTGGQLLATWQHADSSVSSFIVYRSEQPGGPYQRLAQVDSQSYLDGTVLNGTTYYYVVRARDYLGNVGESSNEASGTPMDSEAPSAPFLVGPVASGTIGEVKSRRVTPVGLAEPGTTVIPLHNGMIGSSVKASDESIWQALDSFVIGDLSPSGDLVLDTQWPYTSINLMDWKQQSIQKTLNFDKRYEWVAGGLWLGSDSRVLLVVGDEDWQVHYLIADFDMMALHEVKLAENVEYSIWDAHYDAHHDQLVVWVGSFDSDEVPTGLWKVDPRTGAVLHKPELPQEFGNLGYTSLSPNGEYIAGYDYDREVIAILEIATGHTRTFPAASPETYIAWKGDSSGVLYQHWSDAGFSQISFYSLADGSSTPVVELNGIDATQPVWISGEHFLYVLYSPGMLEFVVHNMATHMEQVLYQRDISDDPVWPTWLQWSQGSFAFVDDRYWNLNVVAPAGRFELAEMLLDEGENQISVFAQDEAGNLSDPSEPATLIYTPSARADLAVSAIVRPAVPMISSNAEIQVDVSNIGRQDAGESTVSVSIIGPDGDIETLADEQVVNALAAGSRQSFFLRWSVPAVSGTYHVVVVADEKNRIEEGSETNNTSITQVQVLPDGNPALTTVVDGDNFEKETVLNVAATIVNPGNLFSGHLTMRIVDENGYLVTTLVDREPISLRAGSTWTRTWAWNTGTTFAGRYVVNTELVDDAGTPVGLTRNEFTIMTVLQPVLLVTSDRSSYSANADVRISSAIANNGANAVLSDAELSLAIVDEHDRVLFSEQRTISEVQPGDRQTVTFNWNTGLHVPGNYSVRVTLNSQDGTELTQASNGFMIKPSKPMLGGQLVVTDPDIPAGNSFYPSYRVTNKGNYRVDNLELSLNFVPSQLGALISADHATVHLDAGGSFESTVVFLTDSLPIGSYKLQLVATYEHERISYSEVLATQFITLVDTTAPTVSILNPAQGAVLNSVYAKAVIFAEDPLSGVKAVQVQVDGGTWHTLPSGQVNTTFDLSFLPDGAHQLAARAQDNAGNLSNPVVVSFTIDNLVPHIQIDGVQSGHFYNMPVTPVITFENASRTTVELNGAAYVSGTTIDVEGTYRLSVYAEDAAGNNAWTSITFTVDRTVPEVLIEGVEDNGLYNDVVSPTYVVEDAYLDSVTATVNGNNFNSGSTIESDGRYEMLVFAKDKAGNVGQAAVVFEIDRTPPEAPQVTNLSDGDVLQSSVLVVEGNAEPGSMVELTLHEMVYTTLADGVGHFAFSDLPVREGAQRLELVAIDRAGNRSASTGLSITVRIQPALEVTGSVSAKAHVLAWIPQPLGIGPHPKDFRELDNFVGSTYEANGVDYKVVRNEWDFVREMRSQRYNVLLIGSLAPALGHPLMMETETQLEIRSIVGAGVGLIWINNHPNLFEAWHDVIGARSLSIMPHIGTVHLENSPVSGKTSYAFNGIHAVRVAVTKGLPVGQLETDCSPHWHLLKYYKDCGYGWWNHHQDHINPALVLNKYGAGGVAMFTFNPSDLVDQVGARSLLMGVTQYAAPTSVARHSKGVVDVNWHVSGIMPPLNLAALQQVPDSLQIVSAKDGNVIDGQTARWSKTLHSDTTTFTSQIQLGNASGVYAASIELHDTVVGSGTLLGEAELALAVQQDRSTLEVQYMEALENMDYSLLDYWRVHMAMVHAQAAITRDVDRHIGLELAIIDLRNSLAWLSYFDQHQSAQALIAGGRLMQHFQALWTETH